MKLSCKIFIQLFLHVLFRLDWNLLSTASPAITAWMNPSNRLAIKIVSLMRALHTRQTAIAACLMADALDNEKIKRSPKIKKVYENMQHLRLCVC